MTKVLLTTPCAPYDLGWGEDSMDLLRSRLARGHDIASLQSDLPTWALYVIAENINHPTTVLEYPHWDDFVRELRRGYDVIGIQLKTVNLERTVRMVEAIKQYSPHSEIVIGGYGVGALDAALPGDVKDHAGWLKRNAHHFCRDEGVKFMREILNDAPFDRPITQYHVPYARFHMPGARRFDLNIPAILVALGCPSACDFCNTSAFYKHKKIYVAEPAETYAFMRHHLEKLGVETLNVILFDEDLFLNPEYVRELGRLIRSDKKTWGLRYVTFGSVRALSQFSGEELRSLGVGGIWIGVESGLVDGECAKEGFAKRDGDKSPVELFDDLHRHGIETIGSMILGFDFHTPDNIEKDIDYFVGLKPMFYQIGPLTPCPGTKLYRDFMAAGRIEDDYGPQHFHLWKDDGVKYKNFEAGQIKHYYDLAHEKLRSVNGPPSVQFLELNLRAYETLRSSSDEFLRYQAEQARTLASGALPIVRAIGHGAASPLVKQRIRTLDVKASQLLGEPSLPMRIIGKAVETYSTLRAEYNDPLEKRAAVSDPGLRVSYYEPGEVPVRKGHFGRADLKPKALARTSPFWARSKQRVQPSESPLERIRVREDEHAPDEQASEKKKRLAVVD